MFEHFLTITVSAVALISASYGFYKWLKARTRRSRVLKAYDKIRVWFDEIDANLSAGIDHDKVSVLERGIDEFLKDHKLEMYELKFLKKFKQRFLKEMGLKRGLWNSEELFQKYSRMKIDAISLQVFWWELQGTFHRFYAEYKKQDSVIASKSLKLLQPHWGDVEQRMKILKRILRIKSS